MIIPGKKDEEIVCVVEQYCFIEEEIDDLEYEALSTSGVMPRFQQCSREKIQTQAERREAWKNANLHGLLGEQTEMGLHYDFLTNRENGIPLAKDDTLAMCTLVNFKFQLGENCEMRRPFVTILGQIGFTGIGCDAKYENAVCAFAGSALPYIL
jgi:hypothetical protein